MLNTDSKIAQILINGDLDSYEFYAPKYVRTEIFQHKEKLEKIANINSEEFLEIYELVLKNVILLDHSILPEKHLENAIRFCKDIDIDDAIFVGFSEYLDCQLWTGDKKLIKGLKAKNYNRAILTDQLHQNMINKKKGNK